MKKINKIKIKYIKLYARLSFKNHSSSPCKKACQKLHVSFTDLLEIVWSGTILQKNLQILVT